MCTPGIKRWRNIKDRRYVPIGANSLWENPLAEGQPALLLYVLEIL